MMPATSSTGSRRSRVARARHPLPGPAWRTEGGAPQSDAADRNPRAWVNVAYRF